MTIARRNVFALPLAVVPSIAVARGDFLLQEAPPPRSADLVAALAGYHRAQDAIEAWDRGWRPAHFDSVEGEEDGVADLLDVMLEATARLHAAAPRTQAVTPSSPPMGSGSGLSLAGHFQHPLAQSLKPLGRTQHRGRNPMTEPSRAALAAIAGRLPEHKTRPSSCQEMQEALDEMHAWSRKHAGLSFEEETQVQDQTDEIYALPLEIADELREIPARTMVLKAQSGSFEVYGLGVRKEICAFPSWSDIQCRGRNFVRPRAEQSLYTTSLVPNTA